MEVTGSTEFPLDYKILNEIGRGHLLSTYLAVHRKTKRPVIIKMLLPGLASNHDTRTEFLKIACQWGQFKHANLMSVLDVCEQADMCFFVTEYMHGRLQKRIRDGITMDEVASITTSVISAVQFLHEHHCIHGNVKTANVMFRRDGTTVLTDFALPGLQTQDSYPSQQSTQNRIQTDLAGLGSLLFEMLTGHDLRQLQIHRASDLTLPVEIAAFRPLLVKTLSINPADWYDSVTDFSHAFVSTLQPGPDSVSTATVDLASISRQIQWPIDMAAPNKRFSLGTLIAVSLACLAVLMAASLWTKTLLREDPVYSKVLSSADPGAKNLPLALDPVNKTEASVVVNTGSQPVPDSRSDEPSPGAEVAQPQVMDTETETEKLDDGLAVETTAAPSELNSKTVAGTAANALTVAEDKPVNPVSPKPRREEQEKTADKQNPEADGGKTRSKKNVIKWQTASLQPQSSAVKKNRPHIRQLEIDKWLKKAESQKKAKQLLKPPKDNAYASYLAVLKLDPENQPAKQGMLFIAGACELQARKHFKLADWDIARAHIKRGLRIVPGHAGLEKMQQKMQVVTATQAYDEAVGKHRGKIQELLVEARGNWKARRLVKPEGDNAYENYRNVLRLDANNQEAKKGLIRMANYCATLAQHAQARGDLDLSLKHIKLGIAIMPSQKLYTMKKDIKERMVAPVRQSSLDEP